MICAAGLAGIWPNRKNKIRSNPLVWVWAGFRRTCIHRKTGRHRSAWFQFRHVHSAGRWVSNLASRHSLTIYFNGGWKSGRLGCLGYLVYRDNWIVEFYHRSLARVINFNCLHTGNVFKRFFDRNRTDGAGHVLYSKRHRAGCGQSRSRYNGECQKKLKYLGFHRFILNRQISIAKWKYETCLCPPTNCYD